MTGRLQPRFSSFSGQVQYLRITVRAPALHGAGRNGSWFSRLRVLNAATTSSRRLTGATARLQQDRRVSRTGASARHEQGQEQ
jgi:hypothetical protein